MWEALRWDKCGRSWIAGGKKWRIPDPEKALLLRERKKKKWKDHVASQCSCLSASVSRRFLDEAYLIPFHIYAPLSSNSFMNKINYFSKQKLILFFSAWLTQDLSTKSHLKTKLNWLSPPGLPGFFPAFFALFFFFFYIFYSQTTCAILFQSHVNDLDIAPQKTWENLG